MQPELLSLVLDPVSGLMLPVSDLEPVLGLAPVLVLDLVPDSASVLAPDSDSVSVPDLVLVLESEFHPYKQL